MQKNSYSPHPPPKKKKKKKKNPDILWNILYILTPVLYTLMLVNQPLRFLSVWNINHQNWHDKQKSGILKEPVTNCFLLHSPYTWCLQTCKRCWDICCEIWCTLQRARNTHTHTNFHTRVNVHVNTFKTGGKKITSTETFKLGQGHQNQYNYVQIHTRIQKKSKCSMWPSNRSKGKKTGMDMSCLIKLSSCFFKDLLKQHLRRIC